MVEDGLKLRYWFQLCLVACWVTPGTWSAASGLAADDPPSVQARCNFGNAPVSGAAAPTVVQMVLSPRMPYALQEWRRMAAVAREAGFQVASFRDPRVPEAEWQDAVAAAGLPELRQTPPLDLEAGQACQVLNHAPATIVARCGRAHAWPILGVMPDQMWLDLLNSRRAALKALPCR